MNELQFYKNRVDLKCRVSEVQGYTLFSLFNLFLLWSSCAQRGVGRKVTINLTDHGDIVFSIQKQSF